MIEDLEKILFKGSRHFKRGHGVIIIPHDRFGMIYKNKKKNLFNVQSVGDMDNARGCRLRNAKSHLINQPRRRNARYVGNMKRVIFVQVLKG